MMTRRHEVITSLAIIIGAAVLLILATSGGLHAEEVVDPASFSNVAADEGPVRPVRGVCPQNTHLVYESTGAAGIEHVDSRIYDDEEYVCQADESCDERAQAAYGSCRVEDGRAVLSCDEGYVGARCDACAEGFRPNGAGDACERAPAEQPKIKLTGFDLSLEQGKTRVLTADLEGIRQYAWEVVSGRGCFTNRGARKCRPSARGSSVIFLAPDSGDDVQLTEIRVTPVCCTRPLPPSVLGTVSTVAHGSIPVSGWGDRELEPILWALRDFMIHRCVGAATIGVSYYGVPVGVWGLGRMEGAPSPVWESDCLNDPFLFGPPVTADTPMSIGSVSKSVTAAITRWQLHRSILEETGLDLNDTEIEALLVFGDNPGMPLQLFPSGLYALYSGERPPPMFLPDSYFYGGSPTDITPLCDTLTTRADPQWREVTVGHLLAHRSGMQRSGTSFAAGLMGNIDIIRGLESERDYDEQEMLLRDMYGDALVDAAEAALGYAAGTNVYFVPGGTLAEYTAQLSGLCLRYNLGDFAYSNRSPLMLATAAEAVRGGPFLAEAGDPDSHEGSALDEFFESELGIKTSGDSGIFRQQPAIGIAGFSYPGPVRRNWNGVTYYPQGWDQKRPHCIWTDGSGCSFGDWINQNPGQINWEWQLQQVPFDRAGAGLGPAAGSLRTEAEVFLRFMSRYWVGGYGSNPRIGEARNNVWDLYTRHNGSLSGGFAWAVQLGNGAPSQWPLPPVTASGHITDDFINLETYACDLPAGVDFIVAVNQRTDPNVVDMAYSRLLNFILYGICQVDWSEVLQPSPIVPPAT